MNFFPYPADEEEENTYPPIDGPGAVFIVNGVEVRVQAGSDETFEQVNARVHGEIAQDVSSL